VNNKIPTPPIDGEPTKKKSRQDNKQLLAGTFDITDAMRIGTDERVLS